MLLFCSKMKIANLSTWEYSMHFLWEPMCLFLNCFARFDAELIEKIEFNKIEGQKLGHSS